MIWALCGAKIHAAMKRFIIAFAMLSLFTSCAFASVITHDVDYKLGGTTLEGYIAYDDAIQGKAPAILIFPEWWGVNNYAERRARELAQLGYVSFVADVYGKGVRPKTAAEAGKTAAIYIKDRALMKARAKAGLDALKSLNMVDRGKIATIGYCFGGGVALELARTGADVKGVACFHGILGTPMPVKRGVLKAKVLVLHGADDPNTPETQLVAFENEMRAAKADWQINIYGGAVHGFTNTDNGSDNSKGLAYNKKADIRSWKALMIFLDEVFGKK